MHAAARSGDLAAIEALHSSGIPLDAVDSAGSTPLMSAIEGARNEEDSMKVVKWLASRGASVNSRDALDCSALGIAASRDYTRVLTFLLEHGADIDATGDSGETALLQATALERGAAVGTLLKRGANPNLGDPLGRTPIHEAVSGSTACLRLLLEHGAEPDLADKFGLSPLHVVMMAPKRSVSEQERYERTRLLLQYGADPQKHCNDPLNIPDSVVGWRVGGEKRPQPGETPLEMATRLGYERISRLLRELRNEQRIVPDDSLLSEEGNRPQ